jgi:hypothetical protein
MVGWVRGEFRSSENKSFGLLRLSHYAKTITLLGNLKTNFQIQKFLINFFRNSNVSLQLKQKKKLVFEKKIWGGNLLKE